MTAARAARSPTTPKLHELDVQLAEAATRSLETPPERDEKWRFVKGNRGGPGNPFARQVAKLRATLIQRVTEEDIQYIADELLASAKMGHLPSIRLLFLYVLGKPAAVVDPDTLDIEEWRQFVQPLSQIMAELPEVLMSVPVQTVNEMVRTAQPFTQQVLSEELTAPPPLMDHEDGDEPEDDPRDEPMANGQARPSTNGVRRPVDALPGWLDKVAGQVRMASLRFRLYFSSG